MNICGSGSMLDTMLFLSSSPLNRWTIHTCRLEDKGANVEERSRAIGQSRICTEATVANICEKIINGRGFGFALIRRFLSSLSPSLSSM